MKPPPFAYHAPRELEHALELLAEHGGDAKVLAGGQSLVPTMSFRLARPAVLVDLNGVDGLAYVEPGEGGGLRLGAMTRQRAAERHALVAERAPLLAGTLPFVAHPQIRNRGTVGGSLAHADPAAELPAVLLALGGRCRVRGVRGERWIGADDLYLGLFETALADDEVLVEVALPPAPERAGWGFHEFSRRHGDYALAGVAAAVVLDADGRCTEARLGLLSVGEGPVLASKAASVLEGEVPGDDVVTAAARAAAHDDIDPPADLHASAAYRRHLVSVLAARALRDAVERAHKT